MRCDHRKIGDSYVCKIFTWNILTKINIKRTKNIKYEYVKLLLKNIIVDDQWIYTSIKRIMMQNF